jgi:hypothetical protein
VIKAGEYGLTVEIPAGKYECYFQSVTDEKHKQMEIDYQVLTHIPNKFDRNLGD